MGLTQSWGLLGSTSYAGVLVGPGDTELTVQPYWSGNSLAQTRVKHSYMPLVPAQMVWSGGGFRAEMLTTLTMRLSLARYLSVAWVRRK